MNIDSSNYQNREFFYQGQVIFSFNSGKEKHPTQINLHDLNNNHVNTKTFAIKEGIQYLNEDGSDNSNIPAYSPLNNENFLRSVALNYQQQNKEFSFKYRPFRDFKHDYWMLVFTSIPEIKNRINPYNLYYGLAENVYYNSLADDPWNWTKMSKVVLELKNSMYFVMNPEDYRTIHLTGNIYNNKFSKIRINNDWVEKNKYFNYELNALAVNVYIEYFFQSINKNDDTILGFNAYHLFTPPIEKNNFTKSVIDRDQVKIKFIFKFKYKSNRYDDY